MSAHAYIGLATKLNNSKNYLTQFLLVRLHHEDILTYICLTINLLITILSICNQDLFISVAKVYIKKQKTNYLRRFFLGIMDFYSYRNTLTYTFGFYFH